MEAKIQLEARNVSALQQWMVAYTVNYQAFNPFSNPVTPLPASLTRRKADDLRYMPHEFRDKTVADLGCNLGFFSFLALDYGAKSVVGYDHLQDIVDCCNGFREVHEKEHPQYKGKLSFQCLDLRLPSIPTYDVLIVHSLIHWFFVSNPEVTMEQVAAWLHTHCNEAVYFEGCVDASEPVMIQNKVDRARYNETLFFQVMRRFFPRVDFKRRMQYNPQRVAVRFYKRVR